jgi:hypothetical protein
MFKELPVAGSLDNGYGSADVQAVRRGYVPPMTGYDLASQSIREYTFLALPSVIL